MAKYGIPPEVQHGFKLIASLDQSQLQGLSETISKIKVGDGISSIAETNKGQTFISAPEFKDILQSIFSMVDIYLESQNSVDKFTSDFSNSYKEITSASDEETLCLKNNLIHIINSFTSIKLTVKGVDLIQDNSNTFKGSRIISDIRIVFSDEMENKQQHAVIVHDLKVNYRQNNRNKEFFVALDFEDLNTLKDVLDRAIKKEESIRKNNYNLEFINFK